MKKRRWISYKAFGGILDVHLEYELGVSGLEAFIRKGLNLSCEYEQESHLSYRFLDTFFSDSIRESLLEDILKKAKSESCCTDILLMNPFSFTAKSRAASIDQELHYQSAKGLKIIVSALLGSRGKLPPQDLEKYDIKKLIRIIHEISNGDLRLKFYDKSPSGPMYFLNHILLCGRFNAGTSAALLPWTMIANDPSIDGDLFDLQEKEFTYLWKTGNDTPKSQESDNIPFSIFISYRKNDTVWPARMLTSYLISEFGPKSVFIDFSSINLGSDFEREIFDAINSCSVFITVIGKKWTDGIHNRTDYVRREVEAALTLNIPVIPVYVEEQSTLGAEQLPDTLAHLVYKQGLRLRPEPDFGSDLNFLIENLKRVRTAQIMLATG